MNNGYKVTGFLSFLMPNLVAANAACVRSSAFVFSNNIFSRNLNFRTNQGISLITPSISTTEVRPNVARMLSSNFSPNSKKVYIEKDPVRIKTPEHKGNTSSEEISNRAKFRMIPVDKNLQFKIQQQKLCSTMGAAVRAANRDAAEREKIKTEKHYRGFSRPPLYTNIPPHLMDFIGESKRDKLKFVAGAIQTSSFLPDDGLPEIAFCGRSNVGKSSVINALTLSTVARSSDKPGMTQQFNFYQLPRRMTLVDLPGYGFAFADVHKKENWRLLMDAYTAGRRSLKRAVVVIDARHGLKANDVEFLDRLERSRTPFQVVLTKCDLTNEEDLARRVTLLSAELRSYTRSAAPVRMVSAFTGAGLLDLVTDLYSLSNRPAPSARRSAPAANVDEGDDGNDDFSDIGRNPAARRLGPPVPLPSRKSQSSSRDSGGGVSRGGRGGGGRGGSRAVGAGATRGQVRGDSRGDDEGDFSRRESDASRGGWQASRGGGARSSSRGGGSFRSGSGMSDQGSRSSRGDSRPRGGGGGPQRGRGGGGGRSSRGR